VVNAFSFLGANSGCGQKDRNYQKTRALWGHSPSIYESESIRICNQSEVRHVHKSDSSYLVV